MKAKCANDGAETKHGGAYSDMRGRHVSGFVAPDRPGTECKLDQNTDEPGGGEPAQRRNIFAMRGNEKPDYSNGNKNRVETVRHLQPDLRGGNVRHRNGVARGVNFCDCGRAGIGNPLTIGGGEIADGKIAMLMPHRRTERELKVDEQ